MTGGGDPLLREIGPGPLVARMRVTKVSYGILHIFAINDNVGGRMRRLWPWMSSVTRFSARGAV